MYTYIPNTATKPKIYNTIIKKYMAGQSYINLMYNQDQQFHKNEFSVRTYDVSKMTKSNKYYVN